MRKLAAILPLYLLPALRAAFGEQHGKVHLPQNFVKMVLLVLIVLEAGDGRQSEHCQAIRLAYVCGNSPARLLLCRQARRNIGETPQAQGKTRENPFKRT
jgi:hypothetical protein